MQSPQLNLSKQHLQVLSYTDNLFSRWALRRNSYLFKHMKPNLQIPLFIIAEERRIAQITQTQSTILQALKLSEFVNVDEDARTVKIVELPTLRFRDQTLLLGFESILKQYLEKRSQKQNIKTTKPLEYIISNKTDDGYYYLVLKSKQGSDQQILNQLATKLGESSSFAAQPLYEQLKQAHWKMRKSKRENQQKQKPSNTNNNYGNRYEGNNSYNSSAKYNDFEVSNPLYSRNNMMHPWMYYPIYGATPEQMQMYANQQAPTKTYGIFIRKAVESDEQPYQQQQLSQLQNQSDKANSSVKQKERDRKQEQKEKKEEKEEKKEEKEKGQQQPQKRKYDKKEQKTNLKHKNKVVLDDNDFPAIG